MRGRWKNTRSRISECLSVTKGIFKRRTEIEARKEPGYTRRNTYNRPGQEATPFRNVSLKTREHCFVFRDLRVMESGVQWTTVHA